MRLEDAPSPGWYPDPEGGSRLRWWEGTDWTDERRAPPTRSEAESALLGAGAEPEAPVRTLERADDTRVRSADADRIVSGVREAARDEVNRAADIFSQRAASAIQAGRSVVGEYIDLVLRVARFAIVVLAVLVILWFVFQFVAQATLLEWLGDRIDSFSDG